MDEFPRQTASRKPFSKEPTKYEKVDGGEERFIQRVPTKKVRWYIQAYIHVFYLE